MPNPPDIIIGAGEPTGGAIARAFAAEGLTVCVTRRERHADALEALAATIRDAGHQARAFPAAARDEAAMIALFDQVQAEVGPVEVAVFNIGPNVTLPIGATRVRVSTKVWEIDSPARFLLGRQAGTPPAAPRRP